MIVCCISTCPIKLCVCSLFLFAILFAVNDKFIKKSQTCNQKTKTWDFGFDVRHGKLLSNIYTELNEVQSFYNKGRRFCFPCAARYYASSLSWWNFWVTFISINAYRNEDMNCETMCVRHTIYSLEIIYLVCFSNLKINIIWKVDIYILLSFLSYIGGFL